MTTNEWTFKKRDELVRRKGVAKARKTRRLLWGFTTGKGTKKLNIRS